ncbi:hypothetical protein TNCV_2219711 [Trichonephila clavipes]|nr:hypothetical protein TNCV_2219711 [Trichonephila clavipes]
MVTDAVGLARRGIEDSGIDSKKQGILVIKQQIMTYMYPVISSSRQISHCYSDSRTVSFGNRMKDIKPNNPT